MTPADVLKLVRVEGVVITLNAAGDLVVVPAPSLELDAAIGANLDALCELLAAPWHRGPCGEAAGCDADGFGWQLPEGLIPILDAAGRFCGWRLDPTWKP